MEGQNNAATQKLKKGTINIKTIKNKNELQWKVYRDTSKELIR